MTKKSLKLVAILGLRQWQIILQQNYLLRLAKQLVVREAQG